MGKGSIAFWREAREGFQGGRKLDSFPMWSRIAMYLGGKES